MMVKMKQVVYDKESCRLVALNRIRPGGARRDGEEVAGCPQQGKCHERVDVRGMRQNCWAGGGP